LCLNECSWGAGSGKGAEESGGGGGGIKGVVGIKRPFSKKGRTMVWGGSRKEVGAVVVRGGRLGLRAFFGVQIGGGGTAGKMRNQGNFLWRRGRLSRELSKKKKFSGEKGPTRGKLWGGVRYQGKGLPVFITRGDLLHKRSR